MKIVAMKKLAAVCNKAEIEIIAASLEVKKLEVSKIKKFVTLSRKLRDKYTGIANRQKREIRGKVPARKAAPLETNAVALLKSQIFRDVLTIFELALKQPVATKVKLPKKIVKSARKKTEKAKNVKQAKRPAKKLSETLIEKKKTKQIKNKSASKVSKVSASKVKKGATLAKLNKPHAGRLSGNIRRAQAKKDSRGSKAK